MRNFCTFLCVKFLSRILYIVLLSRFGIMRDLRQISFRTQSQLNISAFYSLQNSFCCTRQLGPHNTLNFSFCLSYRQQRALLMFEYCSFGNFSHSHTALHIMPLWQKRTSAPNCCWLSCDTWGWLKGQASSSALVFTLLSTERRF